MIPLYIDDIYSILWMCEDRGYGQADGKIKFDLNVSNPLNNSSFFSNFSECANIIETLFSPSGFCPKCVNTGFD